MTHPRDAKLEVLGNAIKQSMLEAMPTLIARKYGADEDDMVSLATIKLVMHVARNPDEQIKNPASLIRTSLRNAAVSMTRRGKRKFEPLTDAVVVDKRRPVDDEADHEAALAAHQLLDKIEAALSDDERVLFKAIRDSSSIKEIADALNCEPEAAAKRRYRLFQRIRQLFNFGDPV